MVKSSVITYTLGYTGKLLTGDEAHTPFLSIKIWAEMRETTINYFFLMEKMLLNLFSLTSPVPQLLHIKAHSVSGINFISPRAAKLRETLLINFYKWCNASFSFSDSRCGCYFPWKKEKKLEEQLCNSTEQFLILKTLSAIMCSRVHNQPKHLSEKSSPISHLVFGQMNYNHHVCHSHSENTGSLGFIGESNSTKSAPSPLHWTKQILPYTFNTRGLQTVTLPHSLMFQNFRPS